MATCSNISLTFTWFLIIFTAILFILSFYQTVIFIIQATNHKQKLSRVLFYPGLIFFIISSSSLLLWNSAILSVCYIDLDDAMSGTLMYVIPAFLAGFVYFTLHPYLLCLLWFIRIYIIFKDTIFALSSYLNKCCIVWFILLPILPFIIVLPILSMINPLIIMCTWNLIMIMSMALLFVCKLCKIYKNTQKYSECQSMDANEQILKALTKTVVLGAISFLFSILMLLGMLCQLIMGYDYIYGLDTELILILFTILDIFNNFVCVILSYNIFNERYTKLCGSMDNMCNMCLYNIVNDKNRAQSEIEFLN
eukprot:391129_1